MNEKRVLLAALISSLFLAWYAQTTTRLPQQHATERSGTQAAQTSESLAKASQPETASIPHLLTEEEVVLIESDDLSVEIGQESAAVRRIVLKKFSDASGGGVLQLRGEFPLFRFSLLPAQPTWHLVEKSSKGIVLRSSQSIDGQVYLLSYNLDTTNPLLHFMLKEEIYHQPLQQATRGVSVVASWKQADSLGQRSNHMEVVVLHEAGGRKSYKRYMAVSRGEKIVPRGTTMLSLTERYFCQSIRFSAGQAQAKILPAPTGQIMSTLLLERATASPAAYVGEIYIGPRDYFYMKRANFESAFPVGMLGQIGLILLLALAWVASITKNYGVAIIVFSGLITCLTAPFTILSFRSMKKMQELKPHIDKLMAKHKDNPKKANAEVLTLYKAHKVSPISGCLPMLLQMPIVIAMFQAITHCIDLRGKSFLWIADLSLPDRIWQLPVALPLLGKDINLLPVLMAFAMFVQTKLSQQNLGSADANPMTKAMSGPMMSVVFGIMFYQFPSGLVLYWLTNSLMSMVWYRVAK